ncbi:MAG TPA: BTAD domain-containing putative transcriptional regulator [Gemmatimonadaceae bacterium]|nr:BTAD domain-containing putative transcriptional regulator [Gemmatimonadaceae bacterium]
MNQTPRDLSEAGFISSLEPNSRPRLRIFGATELVSAEGVPIDDVLRRPKRLALLSYLALGTSGGFQRRDSLLALFWPELDQERARAALRQALYGLGKALGEGVVLKRGAGEVGIDRNRFWCDAVEFDQALENGKDAEALTLYRGDALVGLFVPGAGQELEQWMADARERFRTSAVDSALTLARNALTSRDGSSAARWANWATAHSLDDEKVTRAAMSLLAATGDRAGALRTYDNLASRLRAEFETNPSAETSTLAASIRHGKGESAPPPRVEVIRADHPREIPQPPVVETQHLERSAQPKNKPDRRIAAAVAAAIGVVTIAVSLVLFSRPSPLARLKGHTVFVGPITSPAGAGLDDLANAMPAILTEQLARSDGIRVIDRMRALELHAQRRSSPDSARATVIAARDAGADVVLSGSLQLSRNGSVQLRLSARDVLGHGTISEFEVTGRSTSEIVSHALGDVASIAHSTGAGRTTPQAWRLYEGGLRALATGETRTASELLTDALTLDSAHALAAFYLTTALDRLGETPSTEILRRSVRLSSNASPVDRLRIRARWAEVTNDPLVGQLFDSLVQLAPQDPEANLNAGMARVRNGDFLRAVPFFKQVVHLDSSSRARVGETCLACKALLLLTTTYALSDSTEALVNTLRELAAWEPNNADHWRGLSMTLARLGRFGEMRAARKRELELRPKDSLTLPMDDANVAIAVENYEGADQIFRRVLSAPKSTASDKEDALWWLAISLRQQGRQSEALRCIQRLRAMDSPTSPSIAAMLHHAHIYAELGEWERARILFDSASRQPGLGADLASAYGRQRAWTLTHVARARVARGDTLGVMELADTVRNLGQLSLFGRDWKLHHYIRAQMFEARGDFENAIASYRASIYSPTLGFTSANFRLGWLLIERRRPREAIPILSAALHGGRDASNLYITATEIHELLAKAFELSGSRDSAAVHYAAVAKAWKNADPRLRPRGAAAAERVLQLRAEI